MKRNSDKKLSKSRQKAGSTSSRKTRIPALEDILGTALNFGSTALAEPSDEMIQRCSTIPMLFEPVDPDHPASGKLTYDSWSTALSPSLRDTIDGHVRRLRFEAGRYTIEIVAEKRRQVWEFTARIYKGSEVAHDFVLRVGGRRFLAGPGGFFFWSSRQVPRLVLALSYDHIIQFDEIAW